MGRMTKEKVRMSIKEAERLGVMKRLVKKDLTLRRASEQLGISLKQTRRVRRRYLEEGPQGLISRKRGQPSGNKISEKIRSRAMKIVETKYPDFGPTLAAEKLRERDKVIISVESLRKWMIEGGIWKAKKKKEGRVYQRRERRSCFGEMLQGDGSPHDWFEGRRGKCTLVQFVDDATSQTTAARFVPSETTESYLEILREHLERYGRPLSLYVDKHRIFRIGKEEVKNGTGTTHFGRVLKELDIELICANSPQAKGRVERKNGVFQDRLIKEMRLEEIDTIDEANEFLPRYLERHNKQFGKEAARGENGHRPLRKQDDLGRIFARKDKRRLSKDLTFQHHGMLYMIETKSPNRLKHAYVNILWREKRLIEVEHNGVKLSYKKWSERIDERPMVLDTKEIEAQGGLWTNRKSTKPRKSHPWR
jgi:hypothetical protein